MVQPLARRKEAKEMTEDEILEMRERTRRLEKEDPEKVQQLMQEAIELIKKACDFVDFLHRCESYEARVLSKLVSCFMAVMINPRLPTQAKAETMSVLEDTATKVTMTVGMYGVPGAEILAAMLGLEGGQNEPEAT